MTLDGAHEVVEIFVDRGPVAGLFGGFDVVDDGLHVIDTLVLGGLNNLLDLLLRVAVITVGSALHETRSGGGLLAILARLVVRVERLFVIVVRVRVRVMVRVRVVIATLEETGRTGGELSSLLLLLLVAGLELRKLLLGRGDVGLRVGVADLAKETRHVGLKVVYVGKQRSKSVDAVSAVGGGTVNACVQRKLERGWSCGEESVRKRKVESTAFPSI